MMSDAWFFITGPVIGGLSMMVFYRPMIARLEAEIEVIRKGAPKSDQASE